MYTIFSVFKACKFNNLYENALSMCCADMSPRFPGRFCKHNGHKISF